MRFFLPLFFCGSLLAESLWTVNTAKVKPGMYAYALRYYQAAWLPARQEALRRGVIGSFRLLEAKSEHAKEAEFVLITEYANEQQFADREKNFESIFAAMGRTGPVMIDGKGRAEIFSSLGGLEDYREVGPKGK